MQSREIDDWRCVFLTSICEALLIVNVIENVWASMKSGSGNEASRTQDALVATLLRFWNTHLTVAQCNRYVNHIYKVIPKVIEIRGGVSGY